MSVRAYIRDGHPAVDVEAMVDVDGDGDGDGDVDVDVDVDVDGDGDGDDDGNADASSAQLGRHRDNPRNKLDPVRLPPLVQDGQHANAIEDRRAFQRRRCLEALRDRRDGDQLDYAAIHVEALQVEHGLPSGRSPSALRGSFTSPSPSTTTSTSPSTPTGTSGVDGCGP